MSFQFCQKATRPATRSGQGTTRPEARPQHSQLLHLDWTRTVGVELKDLDPT